MALNNYEEDPFDQESFQQDLEPEPEPVPVSGERVRWTAAR